MQRTQLHKYRRNNNFDEAKFVKILPWNNIIIFISLVSRMSYYRHRQSTIERHHGSFSEFLCEISLFQDFCIFEILFRESKQKFIWRDWILIFKNPICARIKFVDISWIDTNFHEELDSLGIAGEHLNQNNVLYQSSYYYTIALKSIQLNDVS